MCLQVAGPCVVVVPTSPGRLVVVVVVGPAVVVEVVLGSHNLKECFVKGLCPNSQGHCGKEGRDPCLVGPEPSRFSNGLQDLPNDPQPKNEKTGFHHQQFGQLPGATNMKTLLGTHGPTEPFA